MESIMDMSYELLALFIFHTLGVSVFGKFQAETAWWKLTLKWMVILMLIYSLHFFFGHTVSLLVIPLLAIVGVAGHFWWCIKNGIHPLKATPRKRYYELQGWKWME
jgi:hypothetical protein